MNLAEERWSDRTMMGRLRRVLVAGGLVVEGDETEYELFEAARNLVTSGARRK